MTEEAAGDAKGKNVVASLAKGFRVLEAFTAREPELLLSEVARRAGLDNATAFRFLNTLVMLGYVTKVPGTKRFCLTLKPLELGFHAIANSELRDLARPLLRNLVGELNEAASLGILEGPDIVFIERVHAGLIRLGADLRIGSRIPAYYTAIGQAVLAFLPETELARVLAASRIHRVAPRAPATREEVVARLVDVRRDGFALSDADSVSGLRVLAVPVLDRDGGVAAGLSVAAPTVRMPVEEFTRLAMPRLRECATQLGQGLSVVG